MEIKTLAVGQLETNCYVIIDEENRVCAIVDPGDESNVILNFVEELKLSPRAIFITHGHYDHTMVADELAMEWDVPVYIHEKEVATGHGFHRYQYAAKENIRHYKEGDKIQVGNLTVHVMETPGHSPGSVVLQVESSLFTGDTLFRDGCGRTDLPGGDMDTLMRSLGRIYRLKGVEDVYPGHAEATTLERERRFNHYLKHAAALK